MIYLLDKNGKEFAVAESNITYFMNFEKMLFGVDEKGVFYSPSADGTERRYMKWFQTVNRKFDIVGFDYKCKHYRLIDAGIAKEDEVNKAISNAIMKGELR